LGGEVGGDEYAVAFTASGQWPVEVVLALVGPTRLEVADHEQPGGHAETLLTNVCLDHDMPETVVLPDRFEVSRPMSSPASVIFDIVRSPAGHVAIDASGMLQSFTGEPAEKVGDTFVIHMDRESLNDIPLGKYDVTVNIITFEKDREIAWDLVNDMGLKHYYGYRLEPMDDGGTMVTSYYDWSLINPDWKERFPIIPDTALRATLGILERTARNGL
jgi:hypothetical protein